MLTAISDLPNVNLNTAKESGVVLTTEDKRPTLQLLILAGDYLGLYLFSIELNSIENEFERSNKWLDQFDTENGYKGGLRRNYEALHAVGIHTFSVLTQAVIEGDHITVGEIMDTVCVETTKRLRVLEPEIHGLAIPMRNRYREEKKAELAAIRKKQDLAA